MQAATEEQHKLQEEQLLGSDVKIGLLHGRLSAPDKAQALQKFADGTTPVLIATSVVEVCRPMRACLTPLSLWNVKLAVACCCSDLLA